MLRLKSTVFLGNYLLLRVLRVFRGWYTPLIRPLFVSLQSEQVGTCYAFAGGIEFPACSDLTPFPLTFHYFWPELQTLNHQLLHLTHSFTD